MSETTNNYDSIPAAEVPKAPDYLTQATFDRYTQLRGEIHRIYGEFLAAAAERHRAVKPEAKALELALALEKELVSGWQDGNLPRVVPGQKTRGNSVDFVILSGNVPDGLFDDGYALTDYRMYPDEPYEMQDEYGGMRGVSVRNNEVVLDPYGVPTADPTDPSAFRAEHVTLPIHYPQDLRFTETSVVQALARIEGAMS